MAVRAAYQSLVHLVVEWLRELGLHIGVAGIAKLRLRSLEQESRALGALDIVAPNEIRKLLVGGAAHVF